MAKRNPIDRIVELYETSETARAMLDHVLDAWDAGGEDAVGSLLTHWEDQIAEEKAKERREGMHVVPKPPEPEETTDA
jgi:hypothetical protein